ncbi:MAG: L,D-transpeptidase family protein [Cryomorphaceae bacterium]|nr:L,D-transpeptidase family protein [Cryomorphaceae bacterium]
MRKTLIIILLICLAIFLIYRYGRSIWHPVIMQTKEKETIESIQEKHNQTAWERLQPHLSALDLDTFPKQILLVGLKEEKTLEVWVRKDYGWKKLKDYAFTGFSGILGPKLKQGDRQIPEGIYRVEYLNPNSAYHLSFKINYPNEFDRAKARLDNRTNLGGDIFIHGKDKTIGCIPIGDEGIEELFLMVSHALNRGITVIISPRDFRKNKSFPEIENINWENELYLKIKTALEEIV